jgi:hypothetical protein
MPFDPRNLGVLAYAAGFSLWQYRSLTDSAATIAAPGHMDPVAAMLRPDDMILATAADRGVLLRVVSLNGGSVTLAALGSGTVQPPSVPLTAILDMADQPILDEAGDFILQE